MVAVRAIWMICWTQHAAGRRVRARRRLIFHLAAAVSAECEADFDLGCGRTCAATERLLAACRRLAQNLVVVFASSVAVFGASVTIGCPWWSTTRRCRTRSPATASRKLIGEHLLADYTRKGYVRGRTVSLMTVVVRPGPPNAAASGFLSAIIREPLRGKRAVCPVPPRTEVAVALTASAIEGLLCAASLR